MKKNILNNFQSEKGKYTVCLGNGTATTFTNKEKAERFLAETSTFLTVLTQIENDLNNYAFLGARLFKVPVHELDNETEYKPDLKNVKLKAI